MSYLTQARLASDGSLMQRVTACAASVGVADPQFWVQQRAWVLSAQPGWVEAYAGSGESKPGADESAVTDTMILEAVRALRAEEEAAVEAKAATLERVEPRRLR